MGNRSSQTRVERPQIIASTDVNLLDPRSPMGASMAGYCRTPLRFNEQPSTILELLDPRSPRIGRTPLRSQPYPLHPRAGERLRKRIADDFDQLLGSTDTDEVDFSTDINKLAMELDIEKIEADVAVTPMDITAEETDSEEKDVPADLPELSPRRAFTPADGRDSGFQSGLSPMVGTPSLISAAPSLNQVAMASPPILGLAKSITTSLSAPIAVKQHGSLSSSPVEISAAKSASLRIFSAPKNSPLTPRTLKQNAANRRALGHITNSPVQSPSKRKPMKSSTSTPSSPNCFAQIRESRLNQASPRRMLRA